MPDCPHCGAKMVEYTFSFYRFIGLVLLRLYRAGGPVKIATLGLTHSQRTNFQKLRYWELIEEHENEESRKKAGWWIITERGRAFVEGRIQIHEQVVMYRNVRQRYEGPLIYMHEAMDRYEYRDDYRRQIREQNEAHRRSEGPTEA